MKGRILAIYADLARGKRFMPCGAYTDAAMKADIETVFGGGDPATVRIERDEDDALRNDMIRRWGDKGAERFDDSGMFPKPSALQNRLYSARIVSMFGLNAVASLDEFDDKGLFRLPDGHGFFVPQSKGREVTELRFVRYAELKR